MWLEVLLGVWTALAAIWWVVSFCTISISPGKLEKSIDNRFITVFKPIPRLDSERTKRQLRKALLSFAAQQDQAMEILLGVPQEDAEFWSSEVTLWQKKYPDLKLKSIIGNQEAKAFCENPKIAWQYIMAPHASGSLWLWSDADIIAPISYLSSLRQELAGARLVTNAYVVREVQYFSDLPEALFANVEFYPGARLLGQKPLSVAFGAGMFFSPDDFYQEVGWEKAGSVLADDFLIGNRLQPARLGSITLETFSKSPHLRHSIAHYLRWQKTVRWCRPDGFAAQIFILPVLGWMVGTLLYPYLWPGLVSIVLMESFWAALIFQRVGCRVPFWLYLFFPFWSLGRGAAWLLCWFPWRVRWGGQSWSHA